MKQTFMEGIERKQARDRLNDACIAIERESLSPSHTSVAIALLDAMAIEGGLYAPIDLNVIHMLASVKEDSYGYE